MINRLSMANFVTSIISFLKTKVGIVRIRITLLNRSYRSSIVLNVLDRVEVNNNIKIEGNHSNRPKI